MIPDNAAFLHEVMLSDEPRVSAYVSAMKDIIQESDRVVDIGSGTGVLAANARLMTKSQVTAIEYYELAAEVSRRAFSASVANQVNVIQGSSYEIDVPEPDVVVTETIGRWGPEENIVEICYDFQRRHPSLRALIPCRLTLFAVAGYSDFARARREAWFSSFRARSVDGFDLSKSFDLLDKVYSHTPRFDRLDDMVQSSAPVVVKAYRLGADCDSSFAATVSAPTGANVVHLYFVADLSPNVSLSSSFQHRTHWGHMHYVLPEERSRTLRLSFTAGDGHVTADWGVC